MQEFGHYALVLAWCLSLFAIIGSVLAGKRNSATWLKSGRNSSVLACLCVGLSIAALAWGFVHDDYTNQYIWGHSNKDMQPLYKVTAIWGGMDGSMLLWCFFHAVSVMIVSLNLGSYPRQLGAWVISALNSSLLFFLTVVVFLTNPFRYISAPFIPPDGNGLNPLLQNPYMAIHPPMLYLGFTTFAVPYAFCIAALISGRLSDDWIRVTRRWTLIAWGFLTAGIVLGGHWAYLELGWGGFWAWDPVENASFLPWLTGTAFLHSVMVQQRKSMLKFWNIWLIVITYALTVFGTFLTRSGVVQSVHAFASTDVGWVFLVYLAAILLFVGYYSWKRSGELRSERKIESLFSREAFFLLNNLVFLSICFATLWGVMFPSLSEAITGKKLAVGIPFFNKVNLPLFLFLIFLMGVGPLVAWRKASFQSLKRTFLGPFIFSCLIGVLLLWAGITEFMPILSYSLCFFVLLTILAEFHRGVKVQKLAGDKGTVTGLISLMQRHRARYAGYLVHLGVLVVTISITASMAHKLEKEFSLAKGESYQARRFTLTLDDFGGKEAANYSAAVAQVSLYETATGEKLTELNPELRRYSRSDESTTEVALRMGLREDVYLVLAGFDDKGERATFKLFINPLQVWLWYGAIFMMFGTVLLIIPGHAAKLEVPAESSGLRVS